MTDKKKRILIADDEKALVSVLVDGLSDSYEVDTAENGKQALSKIEKQSYALLLTDYKMPEMTGITLAQKIKRLSPDTAVVMMTAFGSERLRQVIDSLDLDAFVQKPVRLAHLRTLISNILEQTGEGEDRYRAGEIEVSTAVFDPLRELQVNTNARAVLLLSAGGFLINMAGTIDDLDLDSISALISANFVAAAELAKLLGNTAVFDSSVHEGPTYNIYAYSVNADVLLAVIFGVESKVGVVRYYTGKIRPELLAFLAEDDKRNAALAKGISVEIGEDITNTIEAMFDF